MSDLRELLKIHMIREKFEEIHRDHSIEYRMSVYVFNPDEFWQLVQQEAQILADRMMALKLENDVINYEQ